MVFCIVVDAAILILQMVFIYLRTPARVVRSDDWRTHIYALLTRDD